MTYKILLADKVQNMSGLAPKTTSASLILPTVSNISLPSTVPQKLGSGSATGNPRNKCALKPGHSLMHWIRLGNSGVDLADTHGVVQPVTSEELARHNTRNDAWMAIRGKVYNVTRYMDFHPGGVDELMRGIGKDATKLFDEVHAWVNYEQLLAKCLIGPLRGNVIKINTDILQSLKQDTAKAQPPTDTFQIPKVPTFPTTAAALSTPTEIIPRFDWIQKRSEITLFFYTRQFCNPGLLVERSSTNNLRLRILIDQTTHAYNYEFHAGVKWPPSCEQVSSETGKIELSFIKTEAELWPRYGTHSSTKVTQFEDSEYVYEIVENRIFNHDSFLLTLKPQSDTFMVLPVGHHVSITANIDAQTISRSYTPVPYKYLKAQSHQSIGPLNLHFLIKFYESGLLSQPLRHMNVGAKLQISQPKGGFKLRHLLPHNRLALLAAGSGITPMLALMEHLLQRSSNRVEKVILMFFNKTESDIWCKEYLEEVQAVDERFQFVNILSQPNVAWKGDSGRISSNILAPLTDRTAPEFVHYVCICGPSAFNQAAEDILKSIRFSDTNQHVFQG